MNEVRHFDFDASTDRDLGAAFAEHSVAGDWVAFHGTSSINENQIEKTGIHAPQIFTEEEITNLVSVYRSINWYGQQRGGFPSLSTFTWNRTVGASIRPLYLSDYPERCLLYSTEDFAGGETARAIRYAAKDLFDYAANEELQQEHYNLQRRECESLVSMGAMPTPVIRPNLDWLRLKLTEIEPLLDKANSLKDQHQWGVLYAIRFLPTDLQRLASGGPEGIQYFGEVGQEQIIGRARICNLTEEIAILRKQSADSLRISSGAFFTGFQAFLKKAGLQRTSAVPPLNTYDRVVDPEAGEDLSHEIVSRFKSKA
jgi:hypothetical protein